MKFGHVIESNKRDVFVQNHAEYEAKRLVPGLFCFLKKPYMRSKQEVYNLFSMYFNSRQLGIQ